MKKKKFRWDRWLIAKYHYIIAWCKVFLGLSVWAKVVYNRPKRRLCVFCGGYMKRLFKTPVGAMYWCNKCKHRRHLEGGANVIIPDRGRIK